MQVLNMPIQMMFDGDTTIQSIKGNYNLQQSNSNMLREPEAEYNKIELEGLKKQVQQLESQIIDKDKIIELLQKSK